MLKLTRRAGHSAGYLRFRREAPYERCAGGEHGEEEEQENTT